MHPWALGRDGTHQTVSETDRRGRPLKTVICMETGLVRNDPVPGDAELAKFYSEDYRKDYKSAEKPRRRQILRNFRRVAAHVAAFSDVLDQASAVLDVGAGSGEFAFLMTRRGKSVIGVEPNQGYAAYCRDDLGLDVRTAHLSSDLFENQSFDLIRLNHVLEHLNDPVKYLEMMARWLRPGGRLYVEVPNIETYCREKSRGNMFHYGHIWNFNPWTLRAAATLAGLEECPETTARSEGTTGVFFRHPDHAPNDRQLQHPENAEHVHAMIQQHYTGGFPKGKAAKPFAKLAARIEETVTGALMGGPQSIGRKVADGLAPVQQ
ncbi:MAG: class I SAM-dependent methyltransferase [Pseudomonadota bacterium]